MSLASRSLLCPHCWILVSSSCLAGLLVRSTAVLTAALSPAQLFPSHYEIILHSAWHGSPACSQLLDLNICCNATMLTMKIRDGGIELKNFLNCNLISIWLSVIPFAPVHFSAPAWNEFQVPSSVEIMVMIAVYVLTDSSASLPCGVKGHRATCRYWRCF